MARTARQLSASGFYHVMMRGSGKQVIFESPADRQYFLDVIASLKKDCAIELHAYCLMDNHFHLLIRDEQSVLPSFMRRLATSYAMHFNGVHDHTGHVFQERYKSEPVEDDAYYLTVLRYIVQNPVRAGLSVEQMREWSSYPRYFKQADGLVEVSFFRDLVGNDNSIESFLLESDIYSQPVVPAWGRMGDEELRRRICALAGVSSPVQVKALPKGERDRVIRDILALGVSERRVERETGVGRSIIRRLKQG